jgi:hypothetical protein
LFGGGGKREREVRRERERERERQRDKERENRILASDFKASFVCQNVRVMWRVELYTLNAVLYI